MLALGFFTVKPFLHTVSTQTHSGSFYTQIQQTLFAPELKRQEEQEENPPNIAQNGNS